MFRDYEDKARKGKFEKSMALSALNSPKSNLKYCWVVTEESWDAMTAPQRKRFITFMNGIQHLFLQNDFISSANVLRGWPRALQQEFFDRHTKVRHP